MDFSTKMTLLTCFSLFFCFVFYSIFAGVTSRADAYKALIVCHSKFLFIFIFVLIFLQWYFLQQIIWWDVVLGGFIFFSLHHTVFLYVHAVPRMSVSLNILRVIYDHKRPLTSQQIQAFYGEGKGSSYIIEDRLRSMISNKMLLVDKDHVFLSLFGRFCVVLHSIVLSFWNLKSNFEKAQKC